MSVGTSPVTAAATDHPGRAEHLSRAALSAVALGNWPDAMAAAHRCLAGADVAARPDVLARAEATAGIVAAVQGDGTAARALLERSQRLAARLGMSELLDVLQLGRGVEALTSGRYDEACAQLRQLVDADAGSSAWVRTVAAGYLAEAWLRCGAPGGDGTVLAALVELVDGAADPAASGATAYARAIATLTRAGDAALVRALAECPSSRPFDRARINLARGARLRRQRRVSESRPPLHEALAAFERLGATAWADQARSELRASGARRAHRELGDAEALTAQELRIVRMAAEGLTNREIGQRLYLSHRTIGSHLYRAFPKLGIAARSQLRDAVAQLTDADAGLSGATR